MLEQDCTDLFSSLCAVKSHWKLKINNGGVCTPHRLAIRICSSWRTGCWAFNSTPLPTTEISEEPVSTFEGIYRKHVKSGTVPLLINECWKIHSSVHLSMEQHKIQFQDFKGKYRDIASTSFLYRKVINFINNFLMNTSGSALYANLLTPFFPIHSDARNYKVQKEENRNISSLWEDSVLQFQCVCWHTKPGM